MKPREMFRKIYKRLGNRRIEVPVKSAAAIIEETGGMWGSFVTPVEQFAMVVNQNYPAFSSNYIEKCAREVIDGKFKSIAPSYGTDTFFVTRIVNPDAVIATFKPKGENELRKYELIL